MGSFLCTVVDREGPHCLNLVGWFASSRGLAFVVLACVDNLGRYELVCSGNKVKQALDRLARREGWSNTGSRYVRASIVLRY